MSTTTFENFLWAPFENKDFSTTLERVAKRLDETRAADAIHIGGLSLVELGRIDDGIRWLEASTTLMRAAPEWFCNCVDALARKKRYEEALTFVNRGLAIYPNHLRLNYHRAVMYSYLNKDTESLFILDRLSKLHPDNPEIALTRGFTYHKMHRFQDALDIYNSIKNITPVQREEVDNNISGVLTDTCMYDESLSVLRDRHPNSTNPTTLYNQSLSELGLGIWPEGWAHHVYRPCLGMPPHIKRPTRLIDLHGKDLFFFAEQGFGDCIQFVRFAPILHKYCARLTIGAPPALVRLFNTLVDERQFDIIPSGGTIGRFDTALPMLDAPTLLGTTVDTIPADVPYFRLPPLDTGWKRRDARPHVGVVWYGAARENDPRAFSINKRRSMRFEQIEPLLEHFSDHIVFVSLQQEWNSEPHLQKVVEPHYDMFDTAQIVNQLDLVITVDTAICHLAGALGKPVWMLSRYDSCWRWFWDGRESSPWYPTMRIFRQKSHFSWPEVVTRVEEALALLFP